jgi:hypothetical protein
MTHIRKTLFAVALTALTGSALAAAPTAAPAAPAKATVTKHKHVAKTQKENTTSPTKKASEGGKS